MSGISDSPLTAAGSSSHARFPFVTGGVTADRQATILSSPRADAAPQDTGEPAGVGSYPSAKSAADSLLSNVAAPTATSLRLFPSQRPDQHDDAIEGQVLGHFIIRRRIGAGGMGTVFLADDEKLQRQVALKVLSPQQTADPASVQRFINEARAAARLDHDHVARVFFYGDDQGLHYIAYEYVQGGNLRDLIRSRGRLEPAEVVAYAVQLAAALCHTSACGVVHRDIKPSNIIVTQQGKAKLVDLGLARKESLEESAQLTVAGTTLGTFDYISPEQAKDPRNVDVRSDIYSLGCTLYHALTGEPPFPDGTVLQRLLDHQEKDPPDPALKNRRVSPALSAVVRKMMAADQRRRYPSAEALLHDLMLIASAMGLRTLPEGQNALTNLLTGRSQSWWSQNASWIVTAGALFLVAGLWQAYPQLAPLLSTGTLPASSISPSNARPSELTNSEISRTDNTAPPVQPTAGSVTSRNPDASLPDVAGEGPEQIRDATVSAVRPPSLSAGPIPEPGVPTAISPVPLAMNSTILPGTAVDAASAEPRIPSTTPSAENRFPPAATSGVGAVSVNSGNSSSHGKTAGDSATAMKPQPASPSTSLIPEVSRGAGGLSTNTKAGTSPNATDVAIVSPSDDPATAAGSAGAALLAKPFVVNGGSQSFATLEAACAEIRDQGIVELHFDGRRPEPERPIRLIGKRITIQGARGRRPVLWFAPKDGVADPLQSRMITVSGGSLTISNVGLDLQLRSLPGVDLWSLFRLERPQHLRLENAYVTVSNPSHAAAAVIECASPPPAFVKMGAMKDGQPIVASEILVEHSVIRGDSVGIRLRDAAPYNCDFRQSFFALGEWLLHSELSPDVMSPMMDVSLSLTDNTCLLGQGLLKSVGDDNLSGRLPKTRVSARSTVFSCGPGAGLIEQQFPQTTTDFRQSLQWSGDRNHFDAVETMWLVRFNAPPSEERWDFDVWRSFWNTGEAGNLHNQPIAWLSEWRGQEWSKVSPQAIALALQQQAIDSGATFDQPKSGVNWELLPAEPPTSSSRSATLQ